MTAMSGSADRVGTDGIGTVKAWLVAVAFVAAAATALRLWHLDLKSISHPEIYIPRIVMPAGLSEPPSRTTLAEMLSFHFHHEAHPPGWYFLMYVWTGLAGTSEWAIRLPSALFGGLTVIALFLAARPTFGSAVALLSSGLIALHGFHFYWSQIARMYVFGVLLGLVATTLLVHLSRSKVPRPGLEAAYVAAIIAGTQTTELLWALALTHVLWVALVLLPRTQPAFSVPRLLQLQSLALIIASPEFVHGVYRARSGAVQKPDLHFLAEYLTFGFLFADTDFPRDDMNIGAVPAALLLLAALFLIGLALRKARGPDSGPAATAALPRWLAPSAAVAASLAILVLAGSAERRVNPLRVLAVLPFLALAIPYLCRRIVTAAPSLSRPLDRFGGEVALFLLLGLFAPLLITAASLVVPVAEPRTFLVFVPYLLIVISAGILQTLAAPAARAAAIAALLAVFALSVPYNAARPSSPRDYKSLALQIRPLMQPDDLVLVRKRNWADTPIFYYLPDAHYVGEDHAAALAANPAARVWLITWPGKVPRPDPRRALLAGRALLAQADALDARAELFAPADPP